MTGTLLRQVTLVHTPVTDDGGAGASESGPVDVLIDDDGVIVTIGDDADRAAAPRTEIDLAGHLLLPAAVEPHAHLDKAFLAERVENRTGDLRGAIDAMIEAAERIEFGDVVDRAERAARLMARNGYTAVRTHADVVEPMGLRNVEALAEMRRRVAGVIDVEIVALTGTPVTGPAGAGHRTLLREAIDAGADLVGGCPHLESDHELDAATDVFLGIAADAGVGVDLHTDETLDPSVMGLEYLAHRVLDGFDRPVTASHCVSLGQRGVDEQRRIAELVAAAGIGVVTLPQTNLWLGGRGRQPVPRGLTAIDALRDAGVPVAAGADNLQDPFNPLGRACPFESAALMVLAAHDRPLQAWRSVSTDARRVLGRAAGGPAPGQPADLVAVPAATLRAAIADAPPERRVFRGGVEIVVN